MCDFVTISITCELLTKMFAYIHAPFHFKSTRNTKARGCLNSLETFVVISYI